MKKFIIFIAFIFTIIFGCVDPFASENTASAHLSSEISSNQNGTIEWINDFELISKEVTAERYILGKKNPNISGLKDNPDTTIASIGSESADESSFISTNLRYQNKNTISHRSYIYQTIPRAP